MNNFRLTRRETLQMGAVGLAALALPFSLAEEAQAATEPFTLPPLPYAPEALEPVIGSQTMQIHHGKHHQGYVNNLNKALEGHPDYASWPLEDLLGKLNELPESLQKGVRNHGGGHHNHSLFWQSMLPPEKAKKTAPDKALTAAIERDFGTLENLQKKFQEAGAGLFGSGWVWLAADTSTGYLNIRTTANQDSLLLCGHDVPLLGNDVWEHAYYLNYQNRRGDYLKAWWDLVNWDKVSERYS